MPEEPQFKFTHPLEVYLRQLMVIKGVSLTQREVDVVSCLLHMGNRSRKYIADLLCIDFKTVNLHISNASNKFIGGCNVDRMITLLENSECVYPLKSYYLSLLTDNLFKKTLKENLKPHIDKNIPLNCVMVYWQKKPPFFEILKKDLICSGLKVSVENRKGTPLF
ncbi:MAG: helix-turn-helix transcriptional regulator [Candidatus Paracaedibacter sp.]